MKLNPYIAFDGNCEEALNYYKDCLGGEFESLKHFKDGPEEMGGMKVPEDFMDKVMHMTLRFENNVIMASDSIGEVPADSNITLTIGMEDGDEMETIFNKLSDRGKVTMPLQDTFWGARFGMFTDRFGVRWMFNGHD